MTASTPSVPYGFCRCGCGGKTSLAKQTSTRYGHEQGEPLRYIRGHHRAKERKDFSDAAPFKIAGVYCKLLPLTRGFFAIVDASDYPSLATRKWHVQYSKTAGYYACCSLPRKNGRAKAVPLHRVLLGLSADDPRRGDHENGVTLDCRRANLRGATAAQSAQNRRKPAHNTSGFKGVGFIRKQRVWQARIQVDGKAISLGRFPTRHQAGEAYSRAAASLFGEFARGA